MDTINRNIEESLKELNLNINNIDKEMKDYLYRIESSITTLFKQYYTALDELKSVKVTKLSISATANIARQTFENHEILRKYIDKRIHEFEKISLPKIIQKKNQEIKKLKEQIKLMEIRDVNNELLKIENANLQNMIEHKDLIISKKNHKINELRNMSYTQSKRGTISKLKH